MKNKLACFACLALLALIPSALPEDSVSREAEWLALQAGFFNMPIVGLDIVINSELPDTVSAIRPPILKADLSVARVIDTCLGDIREKYPEVADIKLNGSDTTNSVMFLRFRPGLKVFPKYIGELLSNQSFMCSHTVWFDDAEDPMAVMVWFNELVHMPSHLAVAGARVPQAWSVEDASDEFAVSGSGNVIRIERLPGAWRFMLGREKMDAGSLVIERFYFSVSSIWEIKKEGSWVWQNGRETGERLWFRD